MCLGFASWVLCLGDFFVIAGGVWYYCTGLVHIDCCFSQLSGQSWYNSPDAPLYSWDLGSVPISTNMLVLLAQGWAYRPYWGLILCSVVAKCQGLLYPMLGVLHPIGSCLSVTADFS